MRAVDERTGENGRVLVVGSDAVGVRVARTLAAETTFVGFDERFVERVDRDAEEVVVVDPQQFDAPVSGIDTAIIATPTDSRNLLYAQKLSLSSDVSTVIARVSDPQYHEVFASIGADTVCAATAVSDTLCDTYAGSHRHNG